MHAGRRHQMPEIIGFKTEFIVEQFGVARFFLLNNRLRINVPVFALGFGHDGNGFVHQGIQFGVFGGGVHTGHGLKGFVKIAVVKRRSFKIARFQARRYFKVAEGMADVGVSVGFPQLRHHGLFGNAKTICPKTTGPMHVGDSGGVNFCVRALAGVDESFVLGKESS